LSDRERLRRPEPVRSEPIRSWAGILGDAPAGSAGDGENLVSRSIDIGYRVVDEYLRQGRRAAQLWSERGSAPEAFREETQDFAARMLRNASDFAQTWIELLGTGALAARENAGRPASQSPPPPGNLPAPRGDGDVTPRAAPLRVEVHADRASQVALELRPGAAPRSLAVHSLRSVDPALPALEATAPSASDDGVMRISVHVPDDQPAGIYSGLILDLERGIPIGSVSVQLTSPRSASNA